MADGLGKVQRAVLTFIEDAAKAGVDRDFTTADVVRSPKANVSRCCGF
jgi:hypothetical protein